jgi:hypothetical protein
VTLALLVALLAGCGGAQTVDVTGGTTPGATDAPDISSAAPSPAPAATPATDAASPPATSSADSAAIVDLDAALLTPGALPAPSSPFVWVTVRTGSTARPSVRLFDPCQPTDYPTDDQRTDVVVRNLRVEDDRGDAPETATLHQNVARYAPQDAATEAFDGFRRVAQDCADSTDADGIRSSTQVVSASEDRLILQTTPEMGLTTAYAIVERRGDVVTLVRWIPGETRNADRRAGRIADAVSAQLDEAG